MTIKMAILPPGFQAEWPEKIREVVPSAEVRIFDSANEAEVYLQDADCAYGFVSPELFVHATNLRWIQCYAAGPDPSFWHDALLKSNVIVTNFRGMFNEHVAGLALAFVLTFSHNIHVYTRQQLRHDWRSAESRSYLPDLAALIIGLGGIGTETARLCASFGMTVTGIDPKVKSAPEFVSTVLPPEALDSALPQADFVILTVPETPHTRRMIDARRLNLMKQSAILINVGRGASVVMKDLIEALQRKTISGAGLDVFESEPLPSDNLLWTMPNVLLTPHVGANNESPHVPERRTRLIVENCKRFSRGEPLINVVDKVNWF